MVHRSGSTLIIATNDADRKQIYGSNEPQILTDSQNLPQFIDGLDPCAGSTEIQKQKSTLPSNTEPSAVSTPRTPRTFAQSRQARKTLTSPKKGRDRSLNSETPEETNNDTNRISSPTSIRPGLRSNSLEGNTFIRPSDDAIISGLVTPRKRGRKMRKKRKDLGELKKCKSAETLFDASDVESGNQLPMKLTCSLPLDRLSGFLGSILSYARSDLSDSKMTISTDSPETTSNADNVDQDNLGHSSHLIKSLCLYCDKKFSSQKVRSKHTERVHAVTRGRRLSSRNSITCPLNLSFPGCSYCCYNSNKLKIISVSEDLKSLFHHLVDFHSDRYFACKTCAIRFSNSEDLDSHLGENHTAGCSSKVKNLSSKRGRGKNSPLDNNFVVDTTKITQPLQVDTNFSDKASSLGDETSNDPESTPTKTRRQLKQAMENKPLTARSCQNVLRSDETILSRLGVAQNRLPRGRKGVRNRRICTLDSSKLESSSNVVKTRSKVGRVVTSNIMEPLELAPRPPTNSRVEVLSCTFDEDFYESVSINVRRNLSCHLDGKLDGSPTSPSPLSPVATVPAIRSTVVKSPLDVENEIHEASALATLTAFPTLLTAEQYGSDLGGAAKIKRPITKHSWKWKWDCVKKYKYVNEGGKIVKKIKQPMAGLRDLSKLDMWTQLTMRTKHEMARRHYNELSGLNEVLGIGETVREEKRQQIAQLNSILDTRRLPQIILEQSEQTIIKTENLEESSSPSPVRAISPQHQQLLESVFSDLRQANSEDENFPKILNLTRRDPQTSSSQEDLILSGEWARPRCYICFGCGAKFDKLKSLEEHKMFRHPYVYSTHYEIVGRELIEGDLFKHFYIPTKALSRYKEYKQRIVKRIEGDGRIGFNENSTCGEESMDSVNSVPASYTTGTSRSDCDTESKIVSTSTSSSITASIEIEEESVLKFHGRCTKCRRECGGLLELYRHMLDCSGDYAWILAKKRKYRYFGAKKRRHARHNLPIPRRKINKDSNLKGENSDGSSTQKAKSYPTTPRPKPSDAESIRRMLENLPAKRACRQIIPNITKPRVRKIPQGMLVKGKNGKKTKGNVANTTVTAITKRILRNHNKRIYTRHLRQVRNSNRKKLTTTKSTKKSKNKTTDVAEDIQIADKEENNEENSLPQEQTQNCVDITEENIETKRKNVVQTLGKKTRRFVKKISQKLQANKKAFLSKKITRSSVDATENHIASEHHNENITGSTEKNNEKTGTEIEETETKNAAKPKNKKFLKGSSTTLLRKLSFRNSSRNKLSSKKNSTKISSLICDEKNSSTNGMNSDSVISSGQTSVDKKTIDITSTNLLSAQEEKKIVKSKTLKKILSKLKEKGNKKVSYSEETEIKLDTAAIVNVTNNDVQNFETELSASDTSKSVQIDADKNTVIEECTENDVKPKDKSENLACDTSILNINVQPLNLSLPLQPVLQVSPTTKRRSKKLNDCIAMLTGKLQEKLGKPFFESSENLDLALSRQSSTTDISAPQDLSSTSGSFSAEISGTLITECANKLTPEECFDKKPPKRKTVTRKIIKKDNGASDAVNVETNVVNDNIPSIILRPPILKVSSPKAQPNADSNASLYKNPPTFQEKSAAEIASSLKGSQFEDKQIVQNKIETAGEIARQNEKNGCISDDVITCNNDSTTTIMHQSEHIDNIQNSNNSSDNTSSLSSLSENKSLEIDKVAPSSIKGRKKVIRKGVKRKISSISLVEESPVISNMATNALNISEESTSLENSKSLVESEQLAVEKKVIPETISIEKKSTPEQNVPKKKPGRKPKKSFSKTEVFVDNSGHSISAPCNSDISDMKVQENISIDHSCDDVKIANIDCVLEKELSPSDYTECDVENKSSSAGADVCLEPVSRQEDNLVATANILVNSPKKLSPRNKGEPVVKNISKRKGRVGNLKKNAKKVCVTPESLEPDQKDHTLLVTMKPEEVIENTRKEMLDTSLTKTASPTKPAKGRPKKIVDKKINKDINCEENLTVVAPVNKIQEAKQIDAIEGFQGLSKATTAALKKKCGRKKKSVELIENNTIADKVETSIDVTEKSDDINISEKIVNANQVPKVETKKYTRKTVKKSDPKPSTSYDPFDAIKLCLDNPSVYDIINLNEENQVATTTAEPITLYDTLPLSSPSVPLPPLRNRVTDLKPMKSRRGRRPGNFKGGRNKQQDDNKLKPSLTKIVTREDESNQNLKKPNFASTEFTYTDLIQTPPVLNLVNIEEKCRNSQSKDSNFKVGNALTEAEEIVASFLSDDDDAQDQTDKTSTDKPIRLDGAEAILAEPDDLEEENDKELIVNKVVENDDIETVCKIMENPVPNAVIAEEKDLSLINEKFRVICREVSVSLIKLPEETVNLINEGTATKENNLQKPKEKQAFISKQKEEKMIKQEKKKSIGPRSRTRKNKTVEDEFQVTKTAAEEKSQENTKYDINFKENYETASKTGDNNLKVTQNLNEKTKITSNIGNIDEASISSNFKSLDDSETDTRSDSASKKQRKRRKNELAAIVADQLLESFKEVDKSKIDDLKMLENLAYEKSEDLLITGMRLTPTTKRKIIIASENKESTNPSLVKSKDNKLQKRKPGESIKIKSRSKSQPNYKSSVEVPENVDVTADKEDQSNTNLTKKRKLENLISTSHENLFRSLTKIDQPLKLNAEPLPHKHNFRICSNFNTTQFEVFSTFKSSFDTFRSLTDLSFMNRKDILRKSSFVPGSTETSNSVDSQSLRQDDMTKASDTNTGDKSKLSFHKKLKKKFSRKKEKKAESENINELRTGLELFSFEKDANNEIVLPKSFNKISKSFSTSKAQKETKSPIIAKSQFSFSSPDLTRASKASELQLGGECKKPLLRPSILTATLEAPRSSNCDVVTSELTKPLSSRDPRLNKNKVQSQCEDQDVEPKSFERRKMGSIRQMRKSERDVSNLKDQISSENDDLNTAFLHPKERLRSSRKEKVTKVPNEDKIKNFSEIVRTEEDEDNYLFQIAKSVNDKIMSSEDEGDGFEMCNDNSTLLLVGRPPRPSTSMSLRSMPNFNDDQSNGEFLHEDDNTNTELIDMDLEDDMSVYTTFSQDVSRFASKGKFGSKRRRRKSILLTRKPKKQNILSDQPEEIFNCDICNKSFRKAAALSKHQMTLTHIAKLSEHEYLNASKTQPPPQQQEEQLEDEPPMNPVEEIENKSCDNPTEDSHPPQSVLELEMEEKELEPVEELVNEGEAAAAMPVETEVPIEPIDNIVEKPPPAPPVVNLLNQSGIEPISSPEQVETNYERYQSVSSRIALSQEERLFYECCNMLKGSETPMVERTYPLVPYSTYDVPNKPVTPKSSERFSYLGSEVTGNFHHGTAYTVKSPMSQSRTSPRHAYPKLDVNQFSDISSDSNPAFPRAQPHPNLQSNLNYPNPDLTNKTFSPYQHHSEVQNAQTGISSFGQTVPTHNYHGPYFSGENRFTSTQFRNATDGGTASLTARTFINEDHVKDYNSGRETENLSTYNSEITHERNQTGPRQDQNFTSPIHSTSSQGSTTTTTCRMKTKAAMKGYDNFKVSIPTLGLDMQQALERSPHGGCKLTALAEIALGSEAPIATRYPPLQIREEICDDKAKAKPDINEKFVKKYQELIKSNTKPAVPKVGKKKETPEKTGNKLGFKAKKNKQRGGKNAEVSKSPDKQKDIYEFDDSEEMEPSEMKSSMRSRGNKQNEEKIIIPERPFKNIGLDEQQGIKFHKPDDVNNQNDESLMSSTSYSDRDDFNYGSMSDNEDANQDEEGSSDSESNSSARTAKTIENKCLIMGRIFKNATKNRPEDKKSEKCSPEQKKKLPTQELNKLFDSLREAAKETNTLETLQTSVTELVDKSSLPTNSFNEASIPTNVPDKTNHNLNLRKSSVSKRGNPKSSEQSKQAVEKNIKQSEDNAILIKEKESKSELESKESKEKKEIRRRSRRDVSQQQSKEIYKLQSELGMSAEEIANLISEGKRKSQRRCAANRPQKFVETWSSDEYEDFLSTKDIIAFIEEKEKKTRKRKSNSRNNEKKKSSDFSILKPESNSTTNTQIKSDKETVSKGTSNTKVNSEDNSNKKPEKIVDKLLEKISKAQKGMANPIGNKEEKTRPSEESFAKSDKEKKSASIKTSENNSQKRPTLSAKPRLKNKTADSESDFETEWRLSKTTKIKKRRKTISFKEQESSKKLSKPADASRKLPTKSKTSNSSKANPNAKTVASGDGSRPLARRKRVASEMLYYWSSSSDEEFGRIETRDDDDDDDITPEGEHYQQHGWIVGDSHKKLVTLLAIAKGKKVEDCVVKETGHKKKS